MVDGPEFPRTSAPMTPIGKTLPVDKGERRPGALKTDHLPKSGGPEAPNASEIRKRDSQPPLYFTEDQIPLSILSDGILTRAEWGWRRLLINLLVQSSVAEGDTASNLEMPGANATTSRQIHHPPVTGETGANAPAVQNESSSVVRSFRKLLDQLASQPALRQWVADWPSQSRPQIHSFSSLGPSLPEQLGTTHESVSWALLDRLTASVQTSDAPVVGGGILVVPRGPHDPSRAIRWQAYRSSGSEEGTTSHRIVIDGRLSGKPLRVTVTTMGEALSVHVETDNEQVRAGVVAGSSALRPTLQAIGWILTSMTASSPEQGEIQHDA